MKYIIVGIAIIVVTYTAWFFTTHTYVCEEYKTFFYVKERNTGVGVGVSLAGNTTVMPVVGSSKRYIDPIDYSKYPKVFTEERCIKGENWANK
jgi:hypothetical protein